ncbi:hypothetical protein B0H19DRAFT_1055379 [Mycena capillaripes]|nr:hypothetical protein B0H19DRAFT_1055379 [Mycena capillaripes]
MGLHISRPTIDAESVFRGLAGPETMEAAHTDAKHPTANADQMATNVHHSLFALTHDVHLAISAVLAAYVVMLIFRGHPASTDYYTLSGTKAIIADGALGVRDGTVQLLGRPKSFGIALTY